MENKKDALAVNYIHSLKPSDFMLECELTQLKKDLTKGLISQELYERERDYLTAQIRNL